MEKPQDSDPLREAGCGQSGKGPEETLQEAEWRVDEGRAPYVSSRCPPLASLLSPASGQPAAAGHETLEGAQTSPCRR